MCTEVVLKEKLEWAEVYQTNYKQRKAGDAKLILDKLGILG